MYKYRRLIASVIAGLLVLLMLGGSILSALAASSSDIKKHIEELKNQEKTIASQQKEIRGKISSKESEILDLVEKKNQIDQQIKLTQDSIENVTQQLQDFNLLLAQKQNELDDALQRRDDLSERFKARIRSMEENGNLTYWSILFKANSFGDLLDRVDMINEIAQADSQMMRRIQETAQQIETARKELALEKVEIEQAREKLDSDQADLEKQRAESDAIFAELMADHDAMKSAEQKYESQKEDVLKEIAQEQANYQEALAAEEKARKEAEAAARARAAAEEAARRQREAAAAQRQNEASGRSSSTGGSGNNGSGHSQVSASGFIWPTDVHYITCEFGPRYHPITGAYGNHSGMDIGAAYGDPIYACASGTVTKATFGTAYGYHVVINHGNGLSSLYGHMCRYVVSPGQYVTQGEVIGYVGSTGWSTGPHLHLTMYYNGALVDPRPFLP